MVLMVYAGRLEEIFGYVNALANLASKPKGWPLKRSSPCRAAFALVFSTFPTFDTGQSTVARQATTAIHMFMHGPERLTYDVGQRDDRTANDPLVQYLAGSGTDGAFLLPTRPSIKDLQITQVEYDSDVIVDVELNEEPAPALSEGLKNYEFALRCECQVDVSSEIASWVCRNIEPDLGRKDMLARAVSVLNDKDYPTLERFELAGVISEQWARKTNARLADEVLSNLWRWNRKGLTRSEAADLLRERSQHPARMPAYLRRFFKRRKPT